MHKPPLCRAAVRTLFSTTMTLPLYWVDAFASRPFTGNPAAVVPLDQWLDDEVMQKIAFENGLAETAFFVPIGVERYHLRWFTPTVEVDLCGHATLATAYVLFHVLRTVDERVTFDSRSGPLVVTRAGEGLELDFPALETHAEPSPEVASRVVKPSALPRSGLDARRLIFSSSWLTPMPSEPSARTCRKSPHWEDGESS
jgi:predicted PhzF superfamily epimerase YddE/YHI9